MTRIQVEAGKTLLEGYMKHVRSWAESNGFTVSSRGRIPANVQEAYAAAH